MPAKDFLNVVVKNIRENPIKSISGLITILTFVAGIILWIDNRYVHAESMNSYVKEQSIREYQNRIDDKADKIFEIEIRQQLGQTTEVDFAMKKRLEQQVRDLKDNIRAIGGNVN